MKIIIVGAGRIGYSIARELSRERHEITVIDCDDENIEYVANTLDVYTLNGNGASYDILKEAEAGRADLLIAVAQADETNLLACLTAKKLGVRHTIARVRNRDYIKQASILKDELGLSMTINPEEAVANEISRILRFPAASKVESFANGKAESVEIRIGPNSPLAGLQISDFHHKFTDNVLVCAVSRDKDVYIPRGDFVLKAGDRLNIIGAYKEINCFLKKNNSVSRGIRSVIVLGGGVTSFYLVRQLINTGISLKVIDKDESCCAKLKSVFPKAGLVLADGTRASVLNEEGLSSADAFVAATGDDGDNIITSMYAASLGVKKVITRIKEGHIIRMLVDSSLDSIIQPSSIATQRIVQYVRHMQNAYDSNSIDALYYMFEGRIETLEFKINSTFPYLNIPLKKLHISKDALIASIIREGACIIPGGDNMIRSGDSVIITTSRIGVSRLEDIMEAQR